MNFHGVGMDFFWNYTIQLTCYALKSHLPPTGLTWSSALSKCANSRQFCAFSQFLAAYSTLDFTRSHLAGKGNWDLLSCLQLQNILTGLGVNALYGLSLFLVLLPAPRVFSARFSESPPPHPLTKTTFLNSNLIWKQWISSHLVDMPLQIPIFNNYTI